MSVGETRGGKDQRFMSAGKAVPIADIKNALDGLKAEIDLPQEFWDRFAKHLAVRASMSHSRLNDTLGKSVMRLEQAAKEFEASLIALSASRDGKRMMRMAGRHVVDSADFWDVLKRFQSITAEQTFEANPADFFRVTIRLVHDAMPDYGPTELTKVLEKMEAALPGLIFPPNTVPSGRRDYVRNAIRSIG